MKADAIPKAIEDLVTSYRRDASFLNPNLRAVVKAPRDFNDAELLRIGHFLRVRSTEAPAEPPVVLEPAKPSRPAESPAPAASRPAKPARAAAPAGMAAAQPTRSVVVCKACGGTDLEAVVGRYGPYAKCRSCGANTALKIACAGCGERVQSVAGPHGFDGLCSVCDRAYEVRFGAGAAA